MLIKIYPSILKADKVEFGCTVPAVHVLFLSCEGPTVVSPGGAPLCPMSGLSCCPRSPTASCLGFISCVEAHQVGVLVATVLHRLLPRLAFFHQDRLFIVEMVFLVTIRFEPAFFS